MSMEGQLISKTYYETFTDGIEHVHPIQILGELYEQEQQNDSESLSHIRFAQGEIYFLNKDYEAAIFKWENISDELQPWAQKNIADAHLKMNLVAVAEEDYKAVETESDVLKTEVLLQLFSIYIQLGKHEMAVHSIKSAVNLNPDYPDVTDMARTFFEEHNDYGNAIELAINEAIRTESLSWYSVLEGYADQRHTKDVDPNYFKELLTRLYRLNHARFESLTIALWNSYKETDRYFDWLQEVNQLLFDIEIERSYIWENLSSQYQQSYFELINGDLLIKDLTNLIPSHLTNWIIITTSRDSLLASSAVLAWDEVFPASLDESAIQDAESILNRPAHYPGQLEDAVELFMSIKGWAKQNGVTISQRFDWIIRELTDLSKYHLLVAGSATSGKSSFVNTLLDEELMEGSTSATVMFKDADEAEIHAVTDEEARNLVDLNELRKYTKEHDTFIQCNMPISFLHNNRVALIDTPGISTQGKKHDEVFNYYHIADSMLFVLSAESILTGKELDAAIKIKEQNPELSIHFLLSKMDRIASSEEAMDLVEETTARINAYFPYAKVFAFSKYYESDSIFSELNELVDSFDSSNIEKIRTKNILAYIKQSIKYLLEERVEKEHYIIDTITWNEDIVAKLNGAHNQVDDMEENLVNVITNSFAEIKKGVKDKINNKLPELLRNCSDLVTEDADFGKLHVTLNDEMNKRMMNYMDDTVLPDFRYAIQNWIGDSERELQDCQTYLDEMSESFNQLYGDEKLALECDQKVLDDWRRDADRMTRGNYPLEKVNILLGFTPSQFLLKSAGKLFGKITQNKEMLNNKYKQLIENKDYSEIVVNVTDAFMQQFELFEKSLDRDVSIYLASPKEEIDITLQETYDNIENYKYELSEMRKNPEAYRDPLTLFDLKLRQYEWMNSVGKQLQEYQ